MPIRVSCPDCAKVIPASSKFAGLTVHCPDCRALIKVPEIPSSEESLLRVPCRSCPRVINANWKYVGQTVSCPDCGGPIEIADPRLKRSRQSSTHSAPATDPWDDYSSDGSTTGEVSDELQSDFTPPAIPRTKSRTPTEEVTLRSSSRIAPAVPTAPDVAAIRRKKQQEQEAAASAAESAVKEKKPVWAEETRRQLHWIFVACFIPLLVMQFVAIPEVGIDMDEEQAQAVIAQLSANAHLPEDSAVHWLYAAMSAVGFGTLLALMFPRVKTPAYSMVWTGIGTGTVGIAVLLVVQFIAIFTAALAPGMGLMSLPLGILKLIGVAYLLAFSAGSSFAGSLIGFTFGVGLCEEFCKAIPVVFYLRNAEKVGWRKACLVGLASGVGFGVSEGIHYSAEMYNGVMPWMVYLVRFVSCVSFHAVLTGAVAILMYNNQDYVHEMFSGWNMFFFVLYYLGVAMVLHGLYNTLLKHGLSSLALVIALGCCFWLRFLIKDSTEAAASR
jgi:RsiW-degrading membrane proteinase PrsW (M82 family)